MPGTRLHAPATRVAPPVSAPRTRLGASAGAGPSWPVSRQLSRCRGPPDTGALCDLYGTRSDERALLVQLSGDAGKRGWWTAYDDIFDGSFVADEALASRIRNWEPQLVPGLLQVERYAWEVMEAGRPDDSSEEIRRRVMARMARRTLLSTPDAPHLTAVMDEAVLRRPVGGVAVLREQLEDLLRPRANVTTQIVPFEVGAFAGLEGGFTLLDFPDETTFPAEAYAENIAGNLYPESAEQLNRINLAFERITQVALPLDQSAALIRRVLKELPGT